MPARGEFTYAGQTKFGQQPASTVLRQRGYSYAAFARAHGIDAQHFRAVISGRVAPNEQDREVLPRVLDLPLSSLFNDEALAAKSGRW